MHKRNSLSTSSSILQSCVATRNYSLIKALFISLVFFLNALHVSAQESNIETKIDPAFRVLIQQQPDANKASRKKCVLKRKNASSKADATAGKLYDCIVYTKNATAVKQRGIIVNSVLPTFVTVKATLKQIQELASMDEITYVASPGMDALPDNNNPIK